MSLTQPDCTTAVRVVMNAYLSVDSSASDSNSGSEALPWKTIQKAANSLYPGDTVLIKKGIYTELFGGSPDTGILAIKSQRSGLSGQYIVYKAYPGDTVVIDQTGKGPGFLIQSKNYIKIQGFEIKNAISGGVYTVAGPQYIVIENNNIHDVDGGPGSNVGGIKFDGCRYCVARNNYIHDITVAGTNTVFKNGANSAGIL